MLDLKKQLEYLESAEAMEDAKLYFARLDAENKRLEARILSFHDKYHDKLDNVMERLITKYESDAYRNKEYRLMYEPREDLYWFMLAYAEKYCKPCTDKKYLNCFTGNAYYIGSYVIQVMHGQGSVIRIDKQNEIN